MANANHTVTIETYLRDNGISEKFKKIGSSINAFGKQAGTVTETFEKTTKGMTETVKVTGKLADKDAILTSATKKTSKAVQQFDSRMMTVMFSAMAVERAVNGIVKSQWDLWGISELTSAAWQITMLPVMEDVSSVAYNLLDVFMSLPEGVQKLIGMGVLFTDFGAKVVTGLAMASLAFPTFGTALTNFLSSTSNKLGGLSGMAGLLGKAITIGVSLKWAGDAIENLNEGNIGSAIGNMLKSGGAIYSIFGKNKGAGMAAIGIGAAIEIADTYFKDGPEAMKKSLEDNLLQVGIVAGASGNWWLSGALFVTWGGIKFGDKLFGKDSLLNKFFGDIPNPFLPGGTSANTVFDKTSPKPGSFLDSNGKQVTDFSTPVEKVVKQISEPSNGIMDGIVKPDGTVIKTAPEDYIFATKNPENLAGGAGNANISVVYNVTVSDKKEFEKILRDNNIKLTEDVRRLIKN
jgi:hypothetical protein